MVKKKYVAYNTVAKKSVGWLGYTLTKKGMVNRLKKFKAPTFIKPKLRKK